MNELLLEPLKYYEKTGAPTHKQNVTEHFEKLLKESNVNVEQNRATVKKYKAEMLTVEKLRAKRAQKIALRVLMIVMIVLGGIALVASIFLFSEKVLYGWIAIAVGVVLLGVSIPLLVAKINPEIKKVTELVEKHEKKAAGIRIEAAKQTAALNALFQEEDTVRLIEKTLPTLDFEPCFTPETCALLVHHCDWAEENDLQTSVLDTLSGRFEGNPFLYRRTRTHRMGTHVYHGTKVISWTEHYIDKDGRSRTRTRTQTLHASVVKPKPEYSYKNVLFYGCQAAPNLSFSRDPQHVERLTEKTREKKVQKGKKRLEEKSEESVGKGGSFQNMANDEFEVLFGATNRNHEVEFRVLYTPLAQCNTVDLLTSKVGYGDDFHFTKRRRCNIIVSEHGQHWTIDSSPQNYYSFDVDEIRRKFIDFNVRYFKSVFFDFAPLFSVPAYLEEGSYGLGDVEYPSHCTTYHHEVMANAIGARTLAHSATRTETIFKTQFLSKGKNTDRVQVTAYSYATQERVDFVLVFGGDGRMHSVPVPWIEYIPLTRITQILVEPPRGDGEKASREELAKRAFVHGASAWLLQEK